MEAARNQFVGTCHRSNVTWAIGVVPEPVNCTSCSRRNRLRASAVEGGEIVVMGGTKTHVRDDSLDYCFCPTCACVTHWRMVKVGKDGTHAMDMHLRMTDPERNAHLPIDRFEGPLSLTDQPRGGRAIRDYWY